MKIYEKEEVLTKLQNLEGWELENNQIQKSYKFKDFKTALIAVNKVADEAENANHHPDILIYSWNKVKFSLYTHNKGGITENDFNLAEKINRSLEGL